MIRKLRFSKSSAVLAGVLCALGAPQAFADAIIYNTGDPDTATLALGVKSHGQLNVTTGNITANASATGLAFKFDDGISGEDWYDATAPGCLCEGWGVSASGISGDANVALGGADGLGLGSFASTASTATSDTFLTGYPEIMITHHYMPSVSSSLFEAVVTITNTDDVTATDVRYTRAMDWDIPPFEFAEYVTIGGTATTSELLDFSDDGFDDPDPLAGPRADIGGCGLGADFVDCGPDDHGAIFDFGFGDLAAGDSRSFSIFYGATDTESEAEAALGEVGAELFSFGQSSPEGDPATFIFAFKGVGGEIIFDDPTPDPPPSSTPPPTTAPEPGSLALLAFGLYGLTRKIKVNLS